MSMIHPPPPHFRTLEDKLWITVSHFLIPQFPVLKLVKFATHHLWSQISVYDATEHMTYEKHMTCEKWLWRGKWNVPDSFNMPNHLSMGNFSQILVLTNMYVLLIDGLCHYWREINGQQVLTDFVGALHNCVRCRYETWQVCSWDPKDGLV